MRGLSCCLLRLELGFMLPMYGGEKDEGAIKVHLHLFVNRKSKNSLVDVVLLTQIRNHGNNTGCNFDIFDLCLWNRFFSWIQWMKLQFLEKICYNKQGSFVLLHRFWDTSVLFDIKEFLKKLLHIMDLCFQVVVKEVLLITMLTVKTYLQLISIRSKDYLQFTSIKHSFQLIMTIKITVIMISIIIISC